jgi:uncharacterized phage protein gp47/JayE
VVKKFGVTESGFVSKKYTDIRDSLHDNAKRMFGADVDLTPGSPIKLLIDMMGVEFVSLWNELELTYNNAFIETATDYSLDSLGKLVGAARDKGFYATGQVTFFRTTPLPNGSPRIIPSGTRLATPMIKPISYLTTESVYFQSLIEDETHTITEAVYSFDAKNHIYDITSITGLLQNISRDYSTMVTFSGKTITFSEPVPEGTIIHISYKPLSITANVIAEKMGADSNVPANSITIMQTPIDFIHYISNEEGIESGGNIETDSHYRKKIIGATQAVGKSTVNALKYYIGKVPGVKNVMVEDPIKTTITEVHTSIGTTNFFVLKNPVFSVEEVIGSTSGTFLVESFDVNTGEVFLTTAPEDGETLTVTYTYVIPGKIKIYVQGGEVGDEFTPNTIVYAIETTRAAGIQAVGYGDSDPSANGSNSAKFSWFYRPGNDDIDVTMIVYFDPNTTLDEYTKEVVLEDIIDKITDYIDGVPLEERINRNKLLKIAMDSSEDILDAQLISWRQSGMEIDSAEAYIEPLTMNISVANEIQVTYEEA